MKINKKITIEKPIETVWKHFVEDFENAEIWMADVIKSYAKKEGNIVDGATMSGRICEVSEKPNGMYLDETITAVDKVNYSISLEIKPTNAPLLLPIKRNILNVSFKSLKENQTQLIWNASPELKVHGYLLYPLLKVGIGKMHQTILDEFKYFAETGKSLK